jgi:sugar O-acyltransferase (sialic acid O-acetyltransferase NeuD family)
VKKLIIIGGRTGALEVKGIVDDINHAIPTYELVGILDDDDTIQGKSVGGIIVLGTLEKAGTFPGVKYVFAIGSIGTQLKRSNIMARLKLEPDDFESIIHPTVILNDSAKVGRGCIVHPRATICNDARIGDFVIVAVASTIGPYATLGDYSMVTSHVLLLSNAKIGEAAFVGSLTCVLENVTIGSYARIGVGSVVGRDVKEGTFAMGNPLRLLGNN